MRSGPIPFETPNTVVLVQAAAVFALLLVLWLAGVMLWSIRRGRREREIEHRLGLGGAGAGPERVLWLWHEDEVASVAVPGRAPGRSILNRLRARHRQANLASDPAHMLLIVAAAAAGLALVAFVLTGGVLLPLCAAPAPLFVYLWLLDTRAGRRNVLFERQFVHALDLASRSLRAGHPLLGAFHLIAEELDPPVSTVFAEICQQHALGVGLEDAIARASSGADSEDLRLFATCLAIQVRSGGNLADMMERLAFVMRERMRLSRRLRILTAQTQFSKRVLAGLPVALFAIMNLINPSYAATLYTTEQGKMLLGVAVGSLVFGVVAMNKMAVIRY